MAKDPAFVWQQQPAGRPASSPRPSGAPAGSAGRAAAATRWVTLHEAEELTGIPSSTVRNWARKDRIASRFELAPEGQVRMVDLEQVVARARHLGRLRPPSPTPPGRSASASAPEEVPPAPEGSVLVPVDAWNRMINQLGNLHEAGQQLAEARERAARAETEARFLRERLSDLRRELEAAPEPVPPPEAEPVPAPDSPEPAWLYLYRRWSNRKRRR